MKNLIYYFSGTGNSLRTAQVVAEALEDCEVLHINRLSALPAGYEHVGFTFPHYALGVPDLVRRKLKAKGLGFHADESCMGCGQCARICPVGNIAMQDGKPVFGAKCEQCMACIQWCPQAAIQYKEETQARKRYQHPQVTLREFITKQGG